MTFWKGKSDYSDKNNQSSELEETGEGEKGETEKERKRV